MESTTKLWQECLSCKNKCCKMVPLFVTPAERERLKGINTRHNYCLFYDNEECDVYDDRPIDCRLFPFDIIKFNGKFCWMIWKIDCPIISKSKEELELILQEHEQELIPKFKEYLDDYAKFRLEESLSKYKFEVLREIKFA